LAGRLDEVLELAATVDALYVSMDDSLRFAVSIEQKNAR
jgi:hypothetical protein